MTVMNRFHDPAYRNPPASPAGRVTATTHVATKQDLSRWTRAHVGVPGISWSVQAGPGGTMSITEHEGDRSSFRAVAAR